MHSINIIIDCKIFHFAPFYFVYRNQSDETADNALNQESFRNAIDHTVD